MGEWESGVGELESQRRARVNLKEVVRATGEKQPEKMDGRTNGEKDSARERKE